MAAHSSKNTRRPNNEITLVIIRGPTGSGKTTFAKRHFRDGKNYKVFAADDYMVNTDGNFEFNPSLLNYSHAKCFKHARRALQKGYDVAIHNSAISKMEMQPLYDLTKGGYNLEIYSMQENYGSDKPIPAFVYEKHVKNFEPVSGEKRVRYDLENDQIVYLE